MERRFCNKCLQKRPSSEFTRRSKVCDSCWSKQLSCQPNYKGRQAAYRRDVWLRHAYGISLAEYNLLLAQQDNKCAICKAPNPTELDHCHTTGRIRGILCHGCNIRVDVCIHKTPDVIRYLQT